VGNEPESFHQRWGVNPRTSSISKTLSEAGVRNAPAGPKQILFLKATAGLIPAGADRGVFSGGDVAFEGSLGLAGAV
jgi:hypothetical protein